MKVIDNFRNAGAPAGRDTQDWALAMRAATSDAPDDRFLANVAAKLAGDQPLSQEQLAELAARANSGELTENQVREAEGVVRTFNAQLTSALAKQKALEELGDLPSLKEDIAALEKRLKLLQAKRQTIEAKRLGLQGVIRGLQQMQLERPDLLPLGFDAERTVRGSNNASGGALSFHPKLA